MEMNGRLPLDPSKIIFVQAYLWTIILPGHDEHNFHRPLGQQGGQISR